MIFLKKLLLGIFSLGIIMFARPGEVGKKYIGETNGYCQNGVVLKKWEIERDSFLKNYVEIVDSPTVVDYDKRILYLRIWN